MYLCPFCKEYRLQLCIAMLICHISTVPAVTTVPEPDNVAESGEDSEDEWNYYRVEPTSEGTQEATQPVCINCYLAVLWSFMELCSFYLTIQTVMCLLTMYYMFQPTHSHCQVRFCVLQVGALYCSQKFLMKFRIINIVKSKLKLVHSPFFRSY